MGYTLFQSWVIELMHKLLLLFFEIVLYLNLGKILY